MAANLKQNLERAGKAGPFWMCGPCVIETHALIEEVATSLKELSSKLDIPVVFKASFDKANRTSHTSLRGPGIEEGLKELQWVKKELELPVLTDVHDVSQIPAVAEVVDIIQIPAFLCRQTDLLEAACKSGCLINIKKGQFLSPSQANSLVKKLEYFKARDFWLTERGTSFGYERLVVDFAAFPELESSGVHLVLDITHAVQLPGAYGSATGGIRDAIPYLARAGAAVGVYGIFAETHPNPEAAWSDGSNVWPLSRLEALMASTKRVAESAHGH